MGENLLKDIDIFQRRIGQYPQLPVNITIAKNDKNYQELIGKSSSIIEFSQACYQGKNQTIFIRNPRDLKNNSQLRKIILHEYIHHFVRYYISKPPLWFNEGMAVYFSNDLTYQREINFVKNYLLGNSRKLEHMKSKYPENRIEWESFYAKSALAVKYLYNEKKGGFYDFWENVGKTKNFEIAFINSFFFTPDEFSRNFEQYSKTHFKIELLLASSGIVWGLFPFIFFIALWRRKIRNKKIEAKWAKNEIVGDI